MAIAKVGQADAAANSVALPAFTAGDLAIVFAFNNAANTNPTVPAGWTIITNGTGNTTGFAIGWRLLVGGDTTTGTWTNATHIEVIVLSGAQAAPTPIGVGLSATGASATPNWPVWTASDGSARSWLVLFGGHRTATNMNSVALGSTTNESPGQGSLALHTARGVSSWASTSKTVNASSGWRTYGIEVIAQGETQRVTQEPMEALVYPTDEKARFSQDPIETLVLPVPNFRNSQDPMEVLVTPIPYFRVSQAPFETLLTPTTTSARFSQAVNEALLLPTDQKMRVSQVAMEALLVAHYDHMQIIWQEEEGGAASG